ncbi:hypothetical protein LB559_00410 [Mesorhizobium sp. BR1-1-3]|uniref:hypothetical protein n=1 Tax=Mesorhizobium sp. BR1-1-3 TaxID=2876651 RepID=UPI001CD04722|nr:hypothetical protein [Mesorhizobium sp. BR1-1-3]MBZ9886407.1 hypothetical protein [Mesorhizobium sp. BR1-1-3]
MKKQKRLYIRAAMPWIIAALFTVLCAWIVLSSEAFQTCISTPQNESGEQNLIEGVAALFIAGIGRYRLCTGEFVHANGESIIAAFTVVLAYSTIGLWASTYKLWLAGEAQIGIARESADAAKVSAATLVSAERAHLWMQKVTLHGVTKEGTGPRPLSFSYVMRNVGHSPAFIFDVRMRFCFVTLTPFSADKFASPPEDVSMFIAPNNGTGTSDAIPINDDDGNQATMAADVVEKYRSGALKLWAYGVIRYKDSISPDQHSAGFCYAIGFGDGGDSEHCSPDGGGAYWTYT